MLMKERKNRKNLLFLQNWETSGDETVVLTPEREVLCWEIWNIFKKFWNKLFVEMEMQIG